MRGGGRSVLKINSKGGSKLSDQLFDPDVPTLASQNKLKISPKGQKKKKKNGKTKEKKKRKRKKKK